MIIELGNWAACFTTVGYRIAMNEQRANNIERTSVALRLRQIIERPDVRDVTPKNERTEVHNLIIDT
ncbi:hypothetical protein Hanom_Chr14g01323361 [Helianthus anomalus]